MMNFDTSERNLCIVKRQSTSTPLQALVLMNDPQFVEAARILAERMYLEGGTSDDTRISFGFRVVTSRDPTDLEMGILERLLAGERDSYADNSLSARQLLETGEYPRNSQLPSHEIASLTTVASTIMNFDATVILR